MNFQRFNTANGRMAALAAGGLGVWAVMAMRQAARRSSSTIARATSSQASTPLTQAQQESNMNNYMAQQPLPPMINNNIKQQNMSRPRNRYEPVWDDTVLQA